MNQGVQSRGREGLPAGKFATGTARLQRSTTASPWALSPWAAATGAARTGRGRETDSAGFSESWRGIQRAMIFHADLAGLVTARGRAASLDKLVRNVTVILQERGRNHGKYACRGGSSNATNCNSPIAPASSPIGSAARVSH
jgi:hypothetical protein